MRRTTALALLIAVAALAPSACAGPVAHAS